MSTALFSYLWLKSPHIPRAFVPFGLIAAAWAALCAFVFITDPAFANVVNPWWFDTPLALFELTLSVVLVVRPLKPPRLPGSGDGVSARQQPATSQAATSA